MYKKNARKLDTGEKLYRTKVYTHTIYIELSRQG